MFARKLLLLRNVGTYLAFWMSHLNGNYVILPWAYLVILNLDNQLWWRSSLCCKHRKIPSWLISLLFTSGKEIDLKIMWVKKLWIVWDIFLFLFYIIELNCPSFLSTSGNSNHFTRLCSHQSCEGINFFDEDSYEKIWEGCF